MRILPALLVAALALGCGSLTPPRRTLPERIETVHLPMPRNESYEYGFEEELARQLHEQFLADGRLQPVRAQFADARLETTITGFSRRVTNFNSDGYPLFEEATIRADLSLWEPGREEPSLAVTDLDVSESFISDARRTQFSPEPEWRARLLRRLAERIVMEVLTHTPEEPGLEESAPGVREVDLDRDRDRTIPSVRSAPGRY